MDVPTNQSTSGLSGAETGAGAETEAGARAGAGAMAEEVKQHLDRLRALREKYNDMKDDMAASLVHVLETVERPEDQASNNSLQKRWSDKYKLLECLREMIVENSRFMGKDINDEAELPTESELEEMIEKTNQQLTEDRINDPELQQMMEEETQREEARRKRRYQSQTH